LSFIDRINNCNDLSTFTRTVNQHEYIYVDGKLVVKKLLRKSNYLQAIKPCKEMKTKILTLDIETRAINNILTPILISIYNGKRLFSYYLSDYDNVDQMIIAALIHLCQKKYHDHVIYAHNLSKFDGIFLLKSLSKLGNTKLEPIIKDGKMIQLKLKFDKHNIILSAGGRDSLLLLPLSLENLAIAFKVSLKSIFPHWFLWNSDVPLNYIGQVPKYVINRDITEQEYNKYSSQFNDNWNLREQITKYCENDCIALYQVISKFNEFIFNLFQLNVQRFPTLPSLALGIFRCNFLKEHKIPLIVGQMFHDIRNSYTGGATDVYISKGENVKGYDMNSQYPYVMANKPMPIGKVNYFEGDITKINPNAFGFFYCKITTPKYLEHPIIQTKIKTDSGMRTIAPLGEWLYI
jgi:hypothetical protein